MAYVIVCKELGLADAFVLPDGAATMERAQELMQHRAEEFLDEDAELRVESGVEPGNLVINLAESKTITRINDLDTGVVRFEMTIMAVTIHE